MLRLATSAALGLFLVVGSLPAADKEEQFEGVIKKIDPDKRAITVTDKDGKDVEFDVVADAKIRLGDKEAKLADVKVGVKVMLVVKANGRGKVIEIKAKPNDKQ